MRWWLLALGLTGMSCQRDVRVVDLHGATDALVFLVHLEGDELVQSVDGPYVVGPDGRLNEGPQSMLPAAGESTEVLVVSLQALETFTAGIDNSSRKRLRFRQDARCWRQGTCTPTIEARDPPAEPQIDLEDGGSVGHLVLAPPPSVVGRQNDPPAWLGQLSLRVPFDLELIEEDQLQPFGAVEEWLQTVEGPVGLADF